MTSPEIPDIGKIANATPEIARFAEDYFATKSRKDVGGTMAFFSPDFLTYSDAVLGWYLKNASELEAIFAAYMPNWGDGLSYHTEVLGGPDSALICLTDTPELFGSEIRALAAVDLRGGKVIRWVDYWDSSTFNDDLYNQLRVPEDQFPSEFREDRVGTNASALIRETAKNLNAAFSAADAEAAASLFSYDGVYEDMALRSQILGRVAIQRYLSRILDRAPYGAGASLRHVVGGDLGGGYEWSAKPGRGVKVGISAIALDSQGKITRFSTVYDSRQLPIDVRKSLILSSAEKL